MNTPSDSSVRSHLISLTPSPLFTHTSYHIQFSTFGGLSVESGHNFLSLPSLSFRTPYSSVSSRDLESWTWSFKFKFKARPWTININRTTRRGIEKNLKTTFFIASYFFFFTELIFLIWSFFRYWIHLTVENFFNSVIRQVGLLLYVWNFLCLQGICVKSSLVTELKETRTLWSSWDCLGRFGCSVLSNTNTPTAYTRICRNVICVHMLSLFS